MAKKKFNPISYVKGSKPGKYTSPYKKSLRESRNAILNFKYDPMQDANYQAMAQIYGARGNTAAQDTLGEAASLNGGYGTSYAVSAAQQARNQYNQELAALVPELEANAYNRLTNNYNVLMDADSTAYQRYRDRMADWQWKKGFNSDVYFSKKSSAGGGGGRGSSGRRSSGGGGGYTAAPSSGGNSMPISEEDFNKLKGNKKKKGGGSSRGSVSPNKNAQMTK